MQSTCVSYMQSLGQLVKQNVDIKRDTLDKLQSGIWPTKLMKLKEPSNGTKELWTGRMFNRWAVDDPSRRHRLEWMTAMPRKGNEREKRKGNKIKRITRENVSIPYILYP